MSKKVYAVKQGRKTGIFYDWEETKKQVDKYPNSLFKSFITLDSAENWLGYKIDSTKNSEKINKLIDDMPPFEATTVYKNYEEFLLQNKLFLKKSKKMNRNKKNNKKETKIKKDMYEAYTCGRYNYKTKTCKYCFVILKNKKQIDYIEEEFKDEKFDIYNDILGDIKATEKVFEYIKDHQIEQITINYRYYNISKWYKHEYKSKVYTIKEFVRNCESIYHNNKIIKFKEASNFNLLKILEEKCK